MDYDKVVEEIMEELGYDVDSPHLVISKQFLRNMLEGYTVGAMEYGEDREIQGIVKGALISLGGIFTAELLFQLFKRHLRNRNNE